MELPKMKDNDNLLRKHHCFQVRPPTPSSAKIELAVDLGWGQVPWCSDSGPFFFILPPGSDAQTEKRIMGGYYLG